MDFEHRIGMPTTEQALPGREEEMPVAERHYMTGIVASLRSEATSKEAAEFFLRYRISAAPVVDDEGQLIGFLSEKDIMGIMLWALSNDILRLFGL